MNVDYFDLEIISEINVHITMKIVLFFCIKLYIRVYMLILEGGTLQRAVDKSNNHIIKFLNLHLCDMRVYFRREQP